MNFDDYINFTSDANFSFWNLSDADDDDESALRDPPLKWGMLSLSIFIVFTALGNILVCLAVCWERRLQNMTNYFLMSLAIADFLVSILVMPLGMTVEMFNGFFPMGPQLCTLWVTFDVGLCTASIWHMCTMSMDRFFTLKYPMKYGRNKTKTMVILKITFVWIVSIAICSPICVLGFIDADNVYKDGMCMIYHANFVVCASILAFYVPLTIMIVTYVLTIRILRNNSKFMRRMDKNRQTMLRRNINIMNANAASNAPTTYNNNQKYLAAPNGFSSYDNEISNDNSLYVTQSRESSMIDPKELAALMSAKSPPPPIAPILARENSSSVSYAQSSDASCVITRQPCVVKPELSSDDAASSVPVKLHDRLNSITSCPETGGANKHNALMSYLSLPGVASSRNLCASVESLVSIHGKDILEAPAEMQEKLSQIELEMEEYLDVPPKRIENDSETDDARCVPDNVTFQSFDARSGIVDESDRNLCDYKTPPNGMGEDDRKLFHQHHHDHKSLPRLKIVENGIHDRPNKDGCWKDNVDVNRRKSFGDAFTHASSKADNFISTNAGQQGRYEICLSDNNESDNEKDMTDSEEESENEDSENEYSGDENDDIVKDTRDDLSRHSEIVTLSLDKKGIYIYQVNYRKGSTSSAAAKESDQLIPGENHNTSTDSESYITAHNGHVTSGDFSSSADNKLNDLAPRNGTGRILVNGLRPPTDRVENNTDEWRERVLRASTNGRQHRWSRQSDSASYQSATAPHFKDKRQHKINIRSLIPKRTANNEKKASKVLGIIFVVFVVLWTPFFVINVLSVSCESCMANVTPEMMSAFLWFGYLASLANPIIYTMFNTSFRNAFYKILTCKYRRIARGERRSSQPESMFLTPSNWISDTRRNTVTYTLNIKEV